MSDFTAGILTIGDELLIGQIIDTNGPWMGEKLTEAGWKVRYHDTVGDRHADIVDSLQRLALHCRIVLVTGGLGPTSDDRTLQAISSFSHRKLVFYPEVEQKILSYFKERNRKVTPSHHKQFYLPEGIEVLKNEAGTAPGLYLEQDGVHFFFMPGVPAELKYIFHHALMPRLEQIITPRFSQARIFTAGIGETDIVERLKDDIEDWPEWVDIAYLPYMGGVRLRITAEGQDPAENEKTIRTITERIRENIGEHFISSGPDQWNRILKDYFEGNGLRLATAESCTGGYIASQITKIPCSGYFMGSVISYDNEVKEQVLGVRSSTLDTHGAVSSQCAEEMLEGVLRAIDADVGVAVTGIAGPTGGTREKPVGTVYISVGNRKKSFTRKIFYKSTRTGIIEYTYNQAMYELYKFLSDQ